MTLAAKLLEENPELLEEMVAEHLLTKRRAQRNASEPVDANVVANPKLGTHIPYPKMLFHHGRKQTQVVSNKDEHDAAKEQGWKETAWSGIGEPVERSAEKENTMPSDAEERFAAIERQQYETQAMLGEILARLNPPPPPPAPEPPKKK